MPSARQLVLPQSGSPVLDLIVSLPLPNPHSQDFTAAELLDFLRSRRSRHFKLLPHKLVKMVALISLVIAIVLFVLLSPGLLLQIPGDERPIEFTNNRTSVSSILVHAIVFALLFFALQWAFGIGVK